MIRPSQTTIPQIPSPQRQSGNTNDEAGSIRIAPSGSGDPAADQLAKANSLYARKMFDFAAIEYSTFLEKFPNAIGRDAAWFRLAESLRQLGKIDRAKAAYENLNREFQNGEFFGSSCYRLGEMALAKDQFHEAFSLFNLAIRHSIKEEFRLSAIYKSALCLIKLDRQTEATERLQKVAESPENNPFLNHAKLAWADLIQSQQSQKSKALELFLQVAAATTGPLRAEATIKGAATAADLGKTDQALKLFTEILRIPEAETWHPIATLGRLRLLHAVGRHRDVVSIKPEALKPLNPDQQAEALSLIATSHRALGENSLAIKKFSELFTLAPQSPHSQKSRLSYLQLLIETNDPTARQELSAFINTSEDSLSKDKAVLLLAELDFREGQLANAAKSYEKIFTSSLPEDVRRKARNKQAWCLLQSGQPQQAFDIYSEIISSGHAGDDLPLLHLQRGLAARRASQPEVAIADFQKIIDDFPQSPECEIALEQKAILLREKRDLTGMKTTYAKLITNYPKSRAIPAAEYWLGWAEFESGNYQPALTHLSRARELAHAEFSEKASIRIALCHYYLKNRKDLAIELSKLQKGAAPPEVLRWLGLTSFEEGDIQTAEKYLAPLAKSGSLDPEALIILAEASDALDKPNQALSTAQSVIESAAAAPSQKARAHLVISNVQRKKKEFDAAQAAADQAMRLQPEGQINALARMAYAQNEFARGNFNEAARAFLSISILFNDPQIVQTSLEQAAKAFKSAGNHQEAQNVITQLNSKFPKSTDPSKTSSPP